MNPDRLMAHSLRNVPWGACVTRIMAAALQAADPAAAVKRHMSRSGDELSIAGKRYNLDQINRVLLVGAGKAGLPMTMAAANILGERLSEGVVIVKEGYATYENQPNHPLPQSIKVFEAGHPIPDMRGVLATKHIIQLLESAGANDLVLCLISGGGSALMLSPRPGLTLSDLQHLTDVLLACGATINEINSLRKHLDQVKGGELAQITSPAELTSLILSDVVGDPLEVIASGPTVADPSTFQDAAQVLEKYHILDQVPVSIRRYLEGGLNGDVSETPKPGDAVFERVHNVIIGSNRQAAQAAVEKARHEGFNSLLLTTYLQGEARHLGPILAAIVRQIAETGHPLPRPACLIAGGETTVTLRGQGVDGGDGYHGMGGRNQELALSAVEDLAGLPDIALVTLATDGGDGPTDAAGAVVTGETFSRAMRIGLHPTDFLERNDSYHFFDALGDLLEPGPTMTNVNDLVFVFGF